MQLKWDEAQHFVQETLGEEFPQDFLAELNEAVQAEDMHAILVARDKMEAFLPEHLATALEEKLKTINRAQKMLQWETSHRGLAPAEEKRVLAQQGRIGLEWKPRRDYDAESEVSSYAPSSVKTSPPALTRRQIDRDDALLHRELRLSILNNFQQTDAFTDSLVGPAGSDEREPEGGREREPPVDLCLQAGKRWGRARARGRRGTSGRR